MKAALPKIMISQSERVILFAADFIPIMLGT